MILRLLIASIPLIIVSLSATFTVAKMAVDVAVMPFEVYSGEGTEYLRNTVTKELSQQIATEKQIAIVDQETVTHVLEGEAPFNFNEFTLRKIAEKLQVHFLVFGSMTKINTSLSLDVYVFDSRRDPPFSKDFVEGSELNSLIREIAQKISAKIIVLASSYPELQEPEVVASKPVSEAPEEKPAVGTSPPSEGTREGEEEGIVTGYLVPGEEERGEVPEVRTEGEVKSETEAEEEKGKVVASVPRRGEKEGVVEKPKAPTKKKSSSTPFASDKPVKITSNTLEADNRSNKVTFKGNVVAKQGDMVIFSDLMSVKYEDQGGGIRTIEASGNVKMTQGDRIATGKKIVFYNPEQEIVMTGSPRIWQSDNLISCEKITVLLAEDKIFFEGAVDSVIYPKGAKEVSQEHTERVEPLPTPPPQITEKAHAEENKIPSAEEGGAHGEDLKGAEGAIRKFILDWKHYWESKNLEHYMACYLKGFTSRGMDWYQWKSYKESLNERYRRISVSLGDPQIVLQQHNQAQVSFTQYYQSDDYSDYGRKFLTLQKEGSNWKICAEEWEPLEEKR